MIERVDPGAGWNPHDRVQDTQPWYRRSLVKFAAIAVAVLAAVFALNAMSVDRAERCQYLLDVETGYVTDPNAPDIAAWTKEYRDLNCRQLAEQNKINARTPQR